MGEIEKYGNYLLIAAFVVIPIWFAWRNTKAEWARKEAAEKTRREVIKNGKRYSVVTAARTLVKEKTTGREAIVIEAGAERIPRMINGEVTMFPRWIRLRYIAKAGSYSKMSGWRASSKFELLGSTDVDEYEEL